MCLPSPDLTDCILAKTLCGRLAPIGPGLASVLQPSLEGTAVCWGHSMRKPSPSRFTCGRFRRLFLFVSVTLVIVFLLNVFVFSPQFVPSPQSTTGFTSELPFPDSSHPLVTPSPTPSSHDPSPIPTSPQPSPPSPDLSSSPRLPSDPITPSREPVPTNDETHSIPTTTPSSPSPRYVPRLSPPYPPTPEFLNLSSIPLDFDPSDIPDVLLYKSYTEKRIYEPELVASIDPRAKWSCRFCAYPNYLPFIRTARTNRVGFADAFITRNGDEIFILAGHHSAGDYSIELTPFGKFSDGFGVLSIGCNTPLKDPGRKTMKIVCEIPDEMKPRILIPSSEYENDVPCYSIQLFRRGRKVLTDSVLLRHCYLPRNSEKEQIKPKPPNKLAVCGMYENRDLFWIEWIEYHRMMGVDHFYIYHHPGGFHYYDTGIDLLSDYIERGIVSVFLWNFTVGFGSRTRGSNYNLDQASAQMDCLSRFGDFYDWMMVTDDDEFVVPQPEAGDSLIELLESRFNDRNASSILMNSWWFHGRRAQFVPETHLSIKMYQGLDKKHAEYHKSIVRPHDLHYFVIHDVSLGGGQMLWANDEEEMFLAHYYYRKWHFTNEVVEPLDYGKGKGELELTGIERFIPELERRVKEQERRIGVEKYEFDYYRNDKRP